VKERRASLHAVLAGVVPEPGKPDPEMTEKEQAEQEEWAKHPTWWLFVITLYCVPLALTNGLYTGILLPPLLSKIVNASAVVDPSSTMTKQAAMGGATTLISAIAISYPLMGWLSDTCPFRYCRSAFIVAGQLCALAGLTLSGLAAHGCNQYSHGGGGATNGGGAVNGSGGVPGADGGGTCLYAEDVPACCEPSCISNLCSWTVFLPGFFLFHFGYQVGWVPYMAVIPKIHPSQRAKIGGFMSFVEAGAGYGANGCGWLVAKQFVSTDFAFVFMFVLNVIAIPLGTLSMQPQPGCTAPDNDNAEKKQRRKREAEATAAAALAGSEAASARLLREGKQQQQLGLGQRLSNWLRRYRVRIREALREFLSAFWTCRAYRLMFIRGFIGSLNPFSIFNFYWYEDVFAPDFKLFGWDLTAGISDNKKATQAILSILGIVSSTVSISLSIPAGYLGDYMDRKPVLFWTAVVGTPLSLVYLFPVPFTAVILISVYSNIVGSLEGPASRAFDADCLPRDKHGKPTDPSRDTALNAWRGVLPGLVMPTLGGLIFNYVDHYLVYKLMFVWGVLLGTINTIIFWFVDPDEEDRDAAQQETVQHWHNGPIGGGQAGWGALLCDRLMFADTLQAARERANRGDGSGLDTNKDDIAEDGKAVKAVQAAALSSV
jgi:hypothetical protein